MNLFCVTVSIVTFPTKTDKKTKKIFIWFSLRSLFNFYAGRLHCENIVKGKVVFMLHGFETLKIILLKEKQ